MDIFNVGCASADQENYSFPRKRFENYDGLISARDYGLGDGNEFLLAKDAQARRLGFAAVQFLCSARRQLRAPRH